MGFSWKLNNRPSVRHTTRNVSVSLEDQFISQNLNIHYFINQFAFYIVWLRGLSTYLRSKRHSGYDTQDVERWVTIFGFGPCHQGQALYCLGVLVLGTTSTYWAGPTCWSLILTGSRVPLDSKAPCIPSARHILNWIFA